MAWTRLFRRRVVDSCETSSSELQRVLSTLDLTLLGIGSTLGTGIYVLAGQVAKTDAGPAVVISFLVAAFASVLAGVCYAEFGARVPKAGSAYVYSYVCVGEVIAFIVGWNLVMEYVIGVASVSKAYSGYVDKLVPDHGMSKLFKEAGLIQVSFLNEYFDFFAFGITILLTILLMFGVKESSMVNNVFTVLNLLVVFFVVVAGSIYSDAANWRVDVGSAAECRNISGNTDEVQPGDVGTGGFMPFGLKGVTVGAATCFYGFIGFDVIATTGEEAKNPKKAIPLSIVLSLLFIFLAYFGISTVLTMMIPYYCQDESAPLPYAFEYMDFEVGKWVVNIGALFALATSLLGSMFPMPRIIYSMAKDGLLFHFLAYVHPGFQTPIVATLIGGLLGALMGAVFRLDSLIDMMSIGTLTAYTLVALCVLMLRYRKDEYGADGVEESPPPVSLANLLGQSINRSKSRVPTRLSTVFTTIAVITYCIVCFIFCAVLIHAQQDGVAEESELMALGVLGGLLILILLLFMFQPVSRHKLNFKVPFLPWIPGLSILVNTYLILELNGATWIRFGIWMAIGLLIYLWCLCSGRTDRTYNRVLEEHRRLSAPLKSSLQGIHNPSLEILDEKQDFPGQVLVQGAEKKGGGGAGDGDLKGPSNHASAHLPKQSLASQESGRKGWLVREKVRTSFGTNHSEPIQSIHAIHASSQDCMGGKRGLEEALLLSSEADKSGQVRTMQEMIGGLLQSSRSSHPPQASHNTQPERMGEGAGVVRIHGDAQAMFTGSTPEEVVSGVIEEAQDLVVQERAERLVELIIALARTELRKPSPAPPFQARKKDGNEFQGRVQFPLDEDLREAQADAQAEEDPALHAHHVIQRCMDKKGSEHLPPLTPAEDLLAAQSALREIVNVLERAPTPATLEVTLPQGFSRRLLATHSAAKSLLSLHTSPEGLDQVNRGVMEGTPGNYPPQTASPSMREELKRAVNQYMRNPRNSAAPVPARLSGKTELGAGQDSESAQELPQSLLEIHEGARALLAPADPLEVIHSICQRCVAKEDVEEKPVLRTRSGREESKRFVQSILLRGEEGSLAGRAPSPELIPGLLALHKEAQEIIMAPPRPCLDAQDSAAKIQVIHQIAELCLNGVNIQSVPWLQTFLTPHQDQESMGRLHSELLEKLGTGADGLESGRSLGVEPPHVVRQAAEDIRRTHQAAQARLKGSERLSWANNPSHHYLPASPPDESPLTLASSSQPEPLYATVSKRAKSASVDVRKGNVSFEEDPSILGILTPPNDDLLASPSRDRLRHRRATGPNIVFTPRKPFQRDSLAEDEEDVEEDEDEMYHSAYEYLESNDEKESGEEQEAAEAGNDGLSNASDKDLEDSAGQEAAHVAVPRRQSQQIRRSDHPIASLENAADTA